MRFGLFQSVQLPDPKSEARYYKEALEQVVWAEKLGFDSAWLTEHHFSRHGIVSSTLTVLAYLAGVTDTIRLGSARHGPALPQPDPGRRGSRHGRSAEQRPVGLRRGAGLPVGRIP